MSAPEPMPRGIFRHLPTGREYHGFLMKHNPDVGESPQDDCFLTVPVQLTGGANNCGESGLFPIPEFAQEFMFSRPEKPNKKFGQS